MVIPAEKFPCDVRDLTWINLWIVMGEGMIKTDTDLKIVYRGQSIALLNTGGKYVPVPGIVMMVSPKGEYVSDEYPEGSIWPEGGWAFAGIYGIFGGVTYLTKYMEKLVP